MTSSSFGSCHDAGQLPPSACTDDVRTVQNHLQTIEGLKQQPPHGQAFLAKLESPSTFGLESSSAAVASLRGGFVEEATYYVLLAKNMTWLVGYCFGPDNEPDKRMCFLDQHGRASRFAEGPDYLPISP